MAGVRALALLISRRLCINTLVNRPDRRPLYIRHTTNPLPWFDRIHVQLFLNVYHP